MSLSVIILLTIAIAFYFTVSQKGLDNKSDIITASPIEEKVPQKEQAIKHEQEENREKPALLPLSENRRLLR